MQKGRNEMNWSEDKYTLQMNLLASHPPAVSLLLYEENPQLILSLIYLGFFLYPYRQFKRDLYCSVLK